MKKILILSLVSLFFFSQTVVAKDACRPSSDTVMLLSEGGSIPSDSDTFYYSASRFPKILKCAESGDLKNFYCIEWEGSVFNKSDKKVTQGARIVFDIKSGLVKDFISSTNQKGFKYLVNSKPVVIDGELKNNIINFINSKFIQSRITLPQMTLVETKEKPNSEDDISKTLKVIISLVKDATGGLHLNCGRTSKISSNFSRIN